MLFGVCIKFICCCESCTRMMGSFLTVGFGFACDTEMQLGNFVPSVLWLNLVRNDMTKYDKKIMHEKRRDKELSN